MSASARAPARAQLRGHLHGGQVRAAEAEARSVGASSSDATAPFLTGSHDNSASCHPGADGVRHFRIRLFPGPGPSRGQCLSVSKVKSRRFCARSSAFRSFLLRPWASAFPDPARSRGPASFRTRLRGTSLPARLFPGRRWPPGTGLKPLQPPGAARAHPARSGGGRGSFLLPSAGRLRGQWRGKCGDRDGSSRWGFPRRRERSSRRPGSGVPSRAAGLTDGPAFSAPRGPACLQEPSSPKDCSADTRDRTWVARGS